MAVNVTNLKKFLNGARVYIGAALPDPFEPVTLNQNGVPTGGTDIGATIGATELHYQATVEGFDIEQSLTPVGQMVTKEEAWAIIRMAETTWQNLRPILRGSHAKVGSRNVLSVGGLTDVTGHSITAVVPLAGTTGKYAGFMLYNASPTEEVTVPLKKGDMGRVVEVRFTAFALTDRPVGDQLFQWFEDE